MAGRELEAVARAVERYQRGENVTQAAKAEGVSRSSLTRAIARRGLATRGSPKGPEHHAWVDGRKSQHV